ncbi:hypothetical protein DFS34DRAFT_673074 [Phlyctochytrium arcticum]|nr:hypothetical protein DFS34DRAFT_689729 [Phlyctochytrium arcticum]KAI9089876.1 hypothetical protein DFS34DRAFT_673074 [Phlyctochytrium arcticum]
MDLNKYTQFTRKNVKFYTNKSKGNGVLDRLLEICEDNEYIIAHCRTYINKRGDSQTYSEYAAVTKQELEGLLQKDHQLFEIMHPDRKQKVAFDIELTGIEDPINKVKNSICEKFPQCEMNISGNWKYVDKGKRNKKYSYHIILDNYHVDCVADLAPVKALCIQPEWKMVGIDPSIYRQKGLFKCINQSKGDLDHNGKPRIQRWISGSKEILDHTLLHNIRADSINVNTLNLPQQHEKKRKRVEGKTTTASTNIKLEDIHDVPKMNLDIPKGFDLTNASPSEHLQKMPNYPRGHKYQLSNVICCSIARWCKTVGISFDEFWEWNKQKDPSSERLEKYRRYYEDRCDWECKTILMKTYLSRVYKCGILQERAIRDFKNMLPLGEKEEHVDILDMQYLSLETLENIREKDIVLHVPCGGNKTGAVISYIFQLMEREPKLCILWGTCRVALTNEQRGRLGDKWKYYLDIDPEEKIDPQNQEKHQYLACSIQSLSKYVTHRISYDIVIMDECETMMHSFSQEATCHNGKSVANWLTLQSLSKSARQVIWMDAFITNITMDNIHSMDEPYTVVRIKPIPSRKLIVHIGQVQTDTANGKPKYNSAVLWEKIFTSLDNGEKIFIATGRLGKRKPDSGSHDESVEGIVACLCKKYGWQRGKEILAYHSDTKSDKKKLENVDMIWGSPQVRVVVGNSCLAVGVNFNPSSELIKKENLRECLAALIKVRIRHPKNPDAHIFFIRGFPAAVKKQGTLLPSTPEYHELFELVNWLNFGQLRRNLDKELRASFNTDVLKALLLLSKFTSFTIDIETEMLCEKEILEIQRQIDTSLSVFNWDNIKTVSDEEFLEVKKRMKSFDADMDDILQYQKYKFTSMFIKEVTDIELAKYWGKSQECAYALQQLGTIKEFGTGEQLPKSCQVGTAAYVIYEILAENNIDWQKMQLSDIGKCSVPFANIKGAFHFRHQPTTYRTDLLAKMFNAFLERKFIERKGKVGLCQILPYQPPL